MQYRQAPRLRRVVLFPLQAPLCTGVGGYCCRYSPWSFYPELGTQLKPLGDAFIKLVKMIIAPVIFLTVATGIAGMTDMKKVGRVAGKAMIYFLTFSTLALIVGLIVANVVQPGAGMHIDPASLDPKAVANYAAKAHEQTITGFLSNIIPTTIVGAFAEGDILQVLFFSVLFGIALALVGDKGKPVTDFLHVLTAPVFKLVAILMKAAPIGAFGAMAFTIGKYGIGSIANLALLIGTFYLTSLLFVLVVLGAVARYNGFDPRAHPLHQGRTASGSGHVFVGSGPPSADGQDGKGRLQAFGGGAGHSDRLLVQSGWHQYLHDVGRALHRTGDGHPAVVERSDSAFAGGDAELQGAAGITGAGFITLAATLSVVPAVPVAGMALILGIDRFMSECRALTNLVGNAVATIVVARWENELDTDKLAAAMNGAPLITDVIPQLEPAE